MAKRVFPTVVNQPASLTVDCRRRNDRHSTSRPAFSPSFIDLLGPIVGHPAISRSCLVSEDNLIQWTAAFDQP